MKELTRAEEQIMQVIWDLEKAFVRDILAELPLPKPAYNTVSTIVRILEEKSFVSHHPMGKSHQYYALVSKEEYREFATKKLLSGYFGGKFENLLSHFVNEKNISLAELQEIIERSKDDSSASK